MATEDYLDKETSLAVELTETGVKASARSRGVSGFDRLLGNISEWGNMLLEPGIVRRRAKMEGERQLIEATAKYGVERLGYDEKFAKRAFENHFGKIVKAQVNKDEVVRAALEDLRQDPPTEAQATSGPDEMDESFLNRFENYAEGATSEELRRRWGRILAAEIRQPGRFSPKVLRTVDEIDPETAKLFESLMRHRVRDALLKPIMPELNFSERVALVSAGLIVEPGMGQSISLIEGDGENGVKFWVFPFGEFAVGLEQNVKLSYGTASPIQDAKGIPAIPAYALTDVGRALSSIIAADENQAGLNFVAKLKDYVDLVPAPLHMFAKNGDGWKEIPVPSGRT